MDSEINGQQDQNYCPTPFYSKNIFKWQSTWRNRLFSYFALSNSKDYWIFDVSCIGQYSYVKSSGESETVVICINLWLSEGYNMWKPTQNGEKSRFFITKILVNPNFEVFMHTILCPTSGSDSARNFKQKSWLLNPKLPLNRPIWS